MFSPSCRNLPKSCWKLRFNQHLKLGDSLEPHKLLSCHWLCNWATFHHTLQAEPRWKESCRIFPGGIALEHLGHSVKSFLPFPSDPCMVHMLTWLGYIDGIHGAPYIAAPFGSYGITVDPFFSKVILKCYPFRWPEDSGYTAEQLQSAFVVSLVPDTELPDWSQFLVGGWPTPLKNHGYIMLYIISGRWF